MKENEEKCCSLAYSSPDGTMCDGFLSNKSCPAGYAEYYSPNSCPERPKYPKGPTDKDYRDAGHKFFLNKKATPCDKFIQFVKEIIWKK